MITKSESEIRNEMIAELQERLPNLDLTEGTPERDIFVEAPVSGHLVNAWGDIIYSAKLHAPHVYVDDLEEADLKNYMENYDVSPDSAKYSEGIVTFYSNSEPTNDVTIPDGTIVRTTDANPIEFATQGTYIIYQAIVSSYFNANTQRWEINCSVKSVIPGADYKAGTGTVTEITSSVAGISGVTNESPITGGEEAESVSEAMERVIEKFQGRGLGPTQGLINFVTPYVDAINVVGANDPEMERDEGLGGAIDFYVIGEDLTDATETVAITSTGLASGVGVSYTSTGIILTNQPVSDITALIVNGDVTPTDYYELVKDTGILAKSTQSSDKVEITSTGLANGFSFGDSDSVEINYIYNALLTEIETDLNSAENHYQNRDYLLREMTEVTIEVYLEFVELSGQDFETVKTTVELTVSDHIDSIKNAGTLEVADVVTVAKNLSTVDNVNITTANLTNTGGGTKTSAGDIIFEKNEYPVAGAITLERWTST